MRRQKKNKREGQGEREGLGQGPWQREEEAGSLEEEERGSGGPGVPPTRTPTPGVPHAGSRHRSPPTPTAMANSAQEEERVVRKRLLNQTLVSRGEPPGKRLSRRYSEFCAAVAARDRAEAAGAREAVLRELALYEFQVGKTRLVQRVNAAAARICAAEEAEIEGQTAAGDLAVLDRKRELDQAKVWRAHQEEYEVTKQKIVKHASVPDTRKRVAQEEEEIAEINALLQRAVDRIGACKDLLQKFQDMTAAVVGEFQRDGELATELQGGEGTGREMDTS